MTTLTFSPAAGSALADAHPNISFDTFGQTVFTLLGSLFLVVLVIRIFNAYVGKKWTEMITEVVAAVFVAWFLFDPTGAKDTIVAWSKQIFG